MLVECKECGKQISDKALACPHCGLPLKSFTEKSTRGKSRKKKRLPNGFGQITKIKGNLRSPYRAMVTIGKTKEGKPICKLLKPKAYFKTYNDAYIALVEYNSKPYEVSSDITCNEVFEKWFEEHSEKVSHSMNKSMLSTWRYCSMLHDLPISIIRIRHIKEVMKDQTINTKKRIKVLWNMLFDYAIEYEMTDKNYARMFHVNEKTEIANEHISFTDEEMKLLWANRNIEIVSMILIQCYMGWRPNELCELLLSNVDVEKWRIIGGSKTKAGEKRIVPVIPAIRNMVLEWYNRSKEAEGKYLFMTSSNGKLSNLTYNMYRSRFKAALSFLGINIDHRPHDSRKQFITLAKKANMNEYAIKKLVGHSINDITEKIYTERDPEWLENEIIKIEELGRNVGLIYE